MNLPTQAGGQRHLVPRRLLARPTSGFRVNAYDCRTRLTRDWAGVQLEPAWAKILEHFALAKLAGLTPMPTSWEGKVVKLKIRTSQLSITHFRFTPQQFQESGSPARSFRFAGNIHQLAGIPTVAQQLRATEASHSS